METNDSALFSKDAPLLTAASELAFHTINCSALNAEELRRENGLEVRVVFSLNIYKVPRSWKQTKSTASISNSICCIRMSYPM
jgi:DnaJ family protein C protein 13